MIFKYHIIQFIFIDIFKNFQYRLKYVSVEIGVEDIMKYFGKFLFFLLIQNALFSWEYEDYEKHNYKSFAELPEANKKIDMTNIDYKLLHAVIFFETCRQRVLHKFKPFKHSPALEKAALGHSIDMVKHNFLSHTSVVRGKQNLSQRLALVGIQEGYRGENIAFTFGIIYNETPIPRPKNGVFRYRNGKIIERHTYLSLGKELLKGWMNSPPHRRNILRPNFTYLGCGARHYKRASFYNMDMFKATQNFSSVYGTDIQKMTQIIVFKE